MANEIVYSGEVMQDSLRDKLSSIFVSMEKNLNIQTQTLSGMYKLQQDSFIMEKNRIEDQARAERFARDEDGVGETTRQTPEVVKPEIDGEKTGSAISDLVTDVIKGMSVGNLLKGVGIVLVSDAVKGYIEQLITNAFGSDTDGDGQNDTPPEGVRKTLLDALFTSVTLGAIGRLFGKRIAGIAAVAGFTFSIAEDAIEAMNNAFGTELDSTFWGGIATIIAGALSLRLPGIIGRALGAGLASMRVPNPFTRNPLQTRPGVGARPAITTPGGATIPDRNFTREMVDGQERFRSNRTGNLLAGNAENVARQTYQRDQDLMRQLEGDTSRTGQMLRKFARFAKVNAVVGGLISLPYIYDIIQSDMAREEKIAALANELGALGGGILGGAVGALGGSVVPGLGTFIGGLMGGAVGSFYGAELANYVAGLMLDGSATFNPDAAAIGETFDNSYAGTGDTTAFVPRPTESGQAGDYARADWDARFSGYLDPSTGSVMEGAVIPERPDESSNYGLDAIAWDRQWRAMQDAIQTPTPGTNLPSSAYPIGLLQPQDDAELMARTQAYLDQIAAEDNQGPMQVTVVDGGENVGQVKYEDNRSTNYFISGGTASAEKSLSPFF